MVNHDAHGIRARSRWNDAARHDGRRRFGHWRRDKRLYFVASNGYTSWVTALLASHYHTCCSLRAGDALPTL